MTGTPTPAIQVTGLRKAFGDHLVLDGIDLTVPAGSVFALLGPNGAGKTTTVNILSTLISADAGTVRVAGHDIGAEPDAVRAAIGVTGQFSSVDGLLTAEENLRLMADLHHLPRAESDRVIPQLLDRFDLADVGRKPVAMFSGGMQRKLDLAMTLVGRPQVVFLDEPTAGLDPRSRRSVWDIVRHLVADGVTILLTTQHLEEADELADTIAVLDDGHIVARGTATELKRLVPGGTVRLTFTDDNALSQASGLFPEATCDAATQTLAVPGTNLAALRDLLGRLERSSLVPDHLEVATPDLDDVFLALTAPAASGALPVREVQP